MADFAIRLLGKELEQVTSADLETGYLLWVNTLGPDNRSVKAVSITDLINKLSEKLGGK